MPSPWLVDESRLLTSAEALEASHGVLGFDRATEPAINIVLHDVTIHDTKQWFGAADIRLDALVVTPAPDQDQLYQAHTFTFSGVRPHQTLSIEAETGLGFYTGWPQCFLDIALVASRSDPGQKSLAEIIASGADQLGSVLENVATLAGAIPQAAAITGAAAAAAKVSGSVLHLLDQITGRSIGLYRSTWYEYRHRFGLGQHPADGDRFRVQGFEFRYEVFQDRPGEG